MQCLSPEWAPDVTTCALTPHPEQDPPEGCTIHASHAKTKLHALTSQKGMGGTTPTTAGGINPSFFRLVQAHMRESAHPALVATNIPTPNATAPSSGMAPPAPPAKANKAGLWLQMACPSAMTCRLQGDAPQPVTQTNTTIQDEGSHTMVSWTLYLSIDFLLSVSHDVWDISTISRYKHVTHSDWLKHRRADG